LAALSSSAAETSTRRAIDGSSSREKALTAAGASLARARRIMSSKADPSLGFSLWSVSHSRSRSATAKTYGAPALSSAAATISPRSSAACASEHPTSDSSDSSAGSSGYSRV